MSYLFGVILAIAAIFAPVGAQGKDGTSSHKSKKHDGNVTPKTPKPPKAHAGSGGHPGGHKEHHNKGGNHQKGDHGGSKAEKHTLTPDQQALHNARAAKKEGKATDEQKANCLGSPTHLLERGCLGAA